MQRAFFENRDQLAAEGISYPVPTASKWNAQHDFVRAFYHGGPDQMSPLLDECRLQIEGGDRLLISSEEMADWRSPKIKAWKAYLDQRFSTPGYRVHMCIRRWSDLVPSLWHQHVISGGLSGFPEYALSQFLQLQRNQRFPFERTAETWIGVFGRDSVRIVPIERITENGGDLVTHTFRSLLGIEAEDLAGKYKSNRSLSPEQLELIRAVSVFGNRRHGKTSRGVSFTLRHMLRRGDADLMAAAERFTPLRTDLSLDDQHAPFVDMESRALKEFGELMEGLQGDGIFPRRDPRQVTYIRDVYWLDHGFRETIESVYARVTGGKDARRSRKRLPRRIWQGIRRWLRAGRR
ncbi:MAG TPA: hypothetical protein VGF43_15990 [Dongiaceae bacterium]